MFGVLAWCSLSGVKELREGGAWIVVGGCMLVVLCIYAPVEQFLK